jgi:tripartite-type tricarboxylate transporter receptor subunit TctC
VTASGRATGRLISSLRAALAQWTWKPGRNIEIIVVSAPGSGGDVTGRFVQRILQERRLVEPSLSVVNKPGATVRKAMEADYADLKSIQIDLELAK